MSNQLLQGQSLFAGQRISANNGRAFLIMQHDGNLVLNEVFFDRNIPVWASGTHGRGGVRVIMQVDGNLVIYTAGGAAVWDSRTWGNGGARLVLQDDGNAVVYSSIGRVLWTSDTWRRRRKLNFDLDRHAFKFGNLFFNQVATIPGFGQVKTLGRCGGMAFAALDYYFGGIPIPSYPSYLFDARRVPPDGHWLADYIYDRLMHSFAVPSSSKYVSWTLAADHATTFGGKGVTRWTKEEEFPRLRALIDSGRPVALGLVRATNLNDIEQNHQVVAYGYEWHPKANTMVVFIYENKIDPYLIVGPDPNTARPEVFLSSGPGDPHFDSSTSPRRPWRGFFVNDYWWKYPPVYTRRPPGLGDTVRYGQTIKVSHGMTGRTLHSHALNYGHAGSSGQQQVTCFSGSDDNDLWRVKGPHGTPANYQVGQTVKRGDIFRLEHVLTQRNLHSHRGFPSPVTRQQEVTCFGAGGIGDSNDNWRVEPAGADYWSARWRFRIVHHDTNHALHSHLGFHDPRWTAGQQEVTGFAGRDSNDWWWLLEIR